MKLFRIISIVLLLLFAADVGRYFFYPNVELLVDKNPAKTAFMEYREAEWRREGLLDKKIEQKWVPLRMAVSIISLALSPESRPSG